MDSGIDVGWKRLHAMPKRYDRYGRPGQTMYQQLLGPLAAGTETVRQRYIREQSTARYQRRPDAYEPDALPLFKGEVGRYEGMRIIGADFGSDDDTKIAVIGNGGFFFANELPPNQMPEPVMRDLYYTMPRATSTSTPRGRRISTSDRPWLSKRKGRS